jgi:hypothetical protein
VLAVKVVAVFGFVAAWGFGDLRAARGHNRTAQSRACQCDTGGAHAHQDPATLKVELL